MMRNWKKAVLAGAAALVVLAAAAVLYSLQYAVDGAFTNLTEQTQQFLRHGQEAWAPYDIRQYETVELGKRAFAAVEIDGQLGLVRMTRGLNGKYQIDSVSRGGGIFRQELADIGAETYAILVGRNRFFGIREMTFSLGQENYRADIPQQDCFITAVAVERPEAGEDWIDPSTIRYYNEAGEDITDQIPKN